MGEGWADCLESDVARMSQRVRDRLVPVRRGYAFNPAIAATPTRKDADVGSRCAFLRGTVGKRCSCSIYEMRPAICAKFKPGGTSCRSMRARLELPQ